MPEENRGPWSKKFETRCTKRLMYEPRELEHNALTDWQPVQLP